MIKSIYLIEQCMKDVLKVRQFNHTKPFGITQGQGIKMWQTKFAPIPIINSVGREADARQVNICLFVGASNFFKAVQMQRLFK